MKFQTRTAEFAVITSLCALLYVGGAVAFWILSDHWPSLGFRLSAIFVYLAVALPAMRRAWKKTDESGPS